MSQPDEAQPTPEPTPEPAKRDSRPTCCACGRPGDDVRYLRALPYAPPSDQAAAHTSSHAGGPASAVAVLCGACETGGIEVRWCCAGAIWEPSRLPVKELERLPEPPPSAGQRPRVPEPVTGEDPWAMAQVPPESEFEGGLDLLMGDHLLAIARGLIAKHPTRFSYLSQYRIKFVWLKEGKVSGGRPLLASNRRLKGSVPYVTGVDAIVEVAADFCRTMRVHHLEALIFHQLLGLDGAKHDFAGYYAEIDTYGAWREDLKRAGAFFEQLRMAV